MRQTQIPAAGKVAGRARDENTDVGFPLTPVMFNVFVLISEDLLLQVLVAEGLASCECAPCAHGLCLMPPVANWGDQLRAMLYHVVNHAQCQLRG